MFLPLIPEGNMLMFHSSPHLQIGKKLNKRNSLMTRSSPNINQEITINPSYKTLTGLTDAVRFLVSYFLISLFPYFLISLFPYFPISVFPYFLISLFPYFPISLFPISY
jgi:hypothetical protein